MTSFAFPRITLSFIAFGIPLFTLSSCTNLSDRKIETALVISIIDLHEAEFVRRSLINSGCMRRTVQVVADQTSTTAYIRIPLKPEKEETVRQSMRAMKASMTEARGRTANTLVFVFPNATLKE
ncbi:hypothetical protein SAMN02745166_02591 [Prosthecobacter debontii]|uniref:Uncharacterized protein n=1 Tax=Prosthecobacter debontii TaxID=48467 RepID=A0A1T4Y6M7_9BACT|nr:hypothetical protein [Prosthecobacter debontii]SKA97313.1 hypothetical protein SAMN02745166_02591 [Prosthecobacter debontii]